ncbi:MAG: hypothetical protein ACC653_08940 [Gammaproteobacteria bacterium]
MNVSITEQIKLAQQAAKGEVLARQQINELIHPIINYQTGRFCKRFCYQNRYRYACSLDNPIGKASRDALLCEWGNASYGWMLNDLSNSNRLLQYQGKYDSSLKNYVYSIANSLPFYERWKNWRFGSNVHVPTYIKEYHPDASHVFYGLRAQESIALIAQKMAKSELEIKDLARAIIVLLTKKKRLHLLDPPVTQSLTDITAGSETDEGYLENDIPCYDETPEHSEDKIKLSNAWSQLDPVEQYVLEAIVIEEQDADDILVALKKLNITIKQGVAAHNTNRQQLYYFKRKTLAKLNSLMGKN